MEAGGGGEGRAAAQRPGRGCEGGEACGAALALVIPHLGAVVGLTLYKLSLGVQLNSVGFDFLPSLKEFNTKCCHLLFNSSGFF